MSLLAWIQEGYDQRKPDKINEKITQFITNYYTRFLLNTKVKICVFITYIALISVAFLGCFYIELGLE